MKKNVTISIPNACSQKWENFSQTEFGAFCSSCSKTVVDFTKMGDNEIVDYFKDKSTRICGRLRNDQLKSYSIDLKPTVSPGFPLLKASVLCMFLLLTGQPIFAQVKPFAPTESVQPTRSESIPNDENNEFTVKGVVKSSEDGSAMPGVNVFMKNDVTIGTVTDGEGQFEFPKKLKNGEVILFTFIGFRTQEYTVAGNKTDDAEVKLLIEMTYDVVGMLGEVSTDEVYTEPTAFSKFWSKVRSIF